MAKRLHEVALRLTPELVLETWLRQLRAYASKERS